MAEAESPNCPDVPVPQHSTLPFDVVAHVCSGPAETEVALMPAGMSAGAGLPVEAVLPVPSWPSALLPQHQTLLLSTSILERVNGDVATALCGSNDCWHGPNTKPDKRKPKKNQ